MNTFMDRVNAIVQQNQQPQNMMAAPQPEPSYPDAGMGALSNIANGAPRQTMIGNQPHMLAYINPEEEALIQSQRGGLPAFEGPGGVPAYWFHSDDGPSFTESVSNAGNAIRDTAKEIFSGGNAVTATYNPPTNDDPPYVAPVITTNNDTVVTAAPVVNTAPTIPTFNTYYDAIDAGYLGKTVNIGGKNVKAVTADGYTGVDTTPAVDTTTAVADPTQTEDFGVLDKLIPDTGENTLGQNIMNLASFLGDKTYVDGVEVDDERTLSEKFANLTLFDGAWYDSTGKLVEVATGDDLTGGGTAEGVFGPNYVHGVSDDFSNNAVDTTGMTDDEILVEDARMQMLEDIPPSMTSYFASFLPGMVIPYFGGMLGEEMLMSGIDKRRAIFDQQIAALEGGATPIFNEAGEYTGYEGEAGTIDYDLSPQEQVMAGPSYDGGVGGSDDDNGTGTNDPVVNRLYNRFFISGSAAGLPAYMARWVNGIDFNETLEKVIIDGKVMYKNAEGAFLSEEDLSTALKYDATEEDIT
jgi:hypothetical protein